MAQSLAATRLAVRLVMVLPCWCFALALGACGGGPVEPPGREAMAGADARPAVFPLVFSVAAPSDVRTGEPVPLRMRLTNAGSTAVTVYVEGAPAAPLYNFVVTRADGRLVWQRFGPSETTPSARVRHELAPDDTLVYELVWDQHDAGGRRVAPGEYHVRALLPTQPFGELGSELVRLAILGE